MNPKLATIGVFFLTACACWGLCDIMNRLDPWTKDIVKRLIAKTKGIDWIKPLDLFGIIFAVVATIRVYMR